MEKTMSDNLDTITSNALEEWMRVRKMPLGPDPATMRALDEWMRVHQKKSIFNPSENYPIGKFNNLESIRLRWLVPRVFDFVPKKDAPFSFTRYNGQTITPRRMFSDGGSIPRMARMLVQLDPWEYTPAYFLHDWIFEVHHCNVVVGKPDIYTFDDATEVLMEAIHTMDYMKIAEISDIVFHVIKFAVSSFVAKSFWNTKVKVCTLPPDFED